jgi:asparaginyl-tRNA synthetase
VRSALAHATHEFFRSRGFLYVHTPLITAADCEGAGEMFQVTTMLQDEKVATAGLPKGKDGKIDYSEDFFGKPAFLTVSGQLSVENYCCALSSVYTFGPTFRAENSHTSRHLAEFWMIEPELAFADIYDDMDCAEDYLKYCVQFVMDNHKDDLVFFDERVEKGLIKRLENLLAEPFGRLTYTEAIDILIKESPKAKFQVPVEWGMDLGSEHERYLAEKVYKKPIIVYNYPADIKAFYMRMNEDGKTVAAMDCLVPGIGEVIGGSQREERLDVLDKMIEGKGLEVKDYWWYRDLRKYGSVPHAGFGLGFERLIMLTTGVENIRDTIPFPRYPGHAEF